jgi:bifunctional non-homologous end joining protein LigD
VGHAARLLHALLDELDITGFVKSTGSKGIHVHIPLDGSDSFEAVRGFARELASELASRDPARLTVQFRKDERGRRLFVDWLRNSYGQHAIAPYSLRALPGAPVAVPLEWAEATSARFDPQRYRLSTVFRRLSHAPDPWQGVHRVAYSVRDREPRLTG